MVRYELQPITYIRKLGGILQIPEDIRGLFEG
jgi:hypothetical protein